MYLHKKKNKLLKEFSLKFFFTFFIHTWLNHIYNRELSNYVSWNLMRKLYNEYPVKMPWKHEYIHIHHAKNSSHTKIENGECWMLNEKILYKSTTDLQ